MLLILLIITSVNIISAEEFPILGQSPRSARIIKEIAKTTDWWVSGSIQPVTIQLSEHELQQGNTVVSERLTTYLSISGGSTYHMHKNIDIVGSIGILAQPEALYFPVLYEAHWYPIKTSITPYLFIGLGGMISRELMLFGSRGFGIKSNITEELSFDIQYRQQRGDVFFFEPYVPLRKKYIQNGIQASILISM
ncbi:MAG: hypothetical protein EBU66_13445 [Bacteroidetes bacterium]|nr:hypothetical protein [bacterium]NBP65650.1 hypothetical protein [Bacteroidota bacterium]